MSAPDSHTNAELVEWLRGRLFQTRGRNALMYQRCADALSALSDTAPLILAAQRMLAASDQFVRDTGLKHRDLITDAAEGLRRALKKVAPQADQEHGLTSIRSTPVQPAGAAPNAATDAALIKGSPKHSDDMPRSVAAPVCVELTFGALRRANVARCIKWNPEGIASWSPSDWLTAVTGELGELASLLKMRNRERDGLPGNKFSPTDKQIADELADVLTYLDLLAEVLGVDLGRAAVEKFNEVSVRVGFPDRIDIAPQPAVRATEYICDKCGIRVDPHRCAGEATF